MAVVLQTSLGDITVDLYIDKVPLLCCNFLKLCKYKYYNNSLFHSVEKDFIARIRPTCDITDVNESIFSLLKREDEDSFNEIINGTSLIKFYTQHRQKIDPKTGYITEDFHPKLSFDKKGTVAMANDVINQIGSLFFITLRENIDYLKNKRSIIGYVTEGFDALSKINNTFFDDVASTKPLQNIRIKHVIILDDPYPDPPGYLFNEEIVSPVSIADYFEQKEDIDVVEDEMAILEKIAHSEAKSRAIALEILGDIPDAEIAPPENILFVCKLNPITESEDLRLIFSRFGKILSCEVIRDWKTGDSLQYAFIEYDNIKSCETALFKMEGCLIDDRRIHVDFCQSVSKQWYNFRNRELYQSKETTPMIKTSMKHQKSNSSSEFVFRDNSHKKKKRSDRYTKVYRKNSETNNKK